MARLELAIFSLTASCCTTQLHGCMVGELGVEPSASRVQGERHTTRLHPDIKNSPVRAYSGFYGYRKLDADWGFVILRLIGHRYHALSILN